MTTASHLRAELGALWKLAAPLSLASAGWALMGVVDTAVAGRAGPAVQGGTGLGNSVFFAVAVLGLGTMMGLDPLVAQAMGAGDRLRARRLLWQGLWLALAVAALLALPLALLSGLLGRAGVVPEVASEAGRFLLVRLVGLPAVLFYGALRAFLQGQGRTRPLLISVVLANLVNFPLAVLLVLGGAALPDWTGPLRQVPALGSAGSALATTLVTLVQASVLALAAREPSGAPAVPRRPERAALGQALRVGLPIGLHSAAEVGVFALVGVLAGRLGAVPLGAHQIVLAVATLSFTLAMGIGNAASVRVGWAVGAGDTPAARRAGLTAFASGGLSMAVAGLVFVLFPGGLAGLFTSDPAVAREAAALFLVAAVFQISDGVQGAGAGVLRGAGDTRFTFAANMVGHWLLGLPLALWLGLTLGLGVTGLWWGLCLGLSVVGGALLLRFLRISRGTIRPLAAAERAGARSGRWPSSPPSCGSGPRRPRWRWFRRSGSTRPPTSPRSGMPPGPSSGAGTSRPSGPFPGPGGRRWRATCSTTPSWSPASGCSTSPPAAAWWPSPRPWPVPPRCGRWTWTPSARRWSRSTPRSAAWRWRCASRTRSALRSPTWTWCWPATSSTSGPWPSGRSPGSGRWRRPA